MSGATDGAVLSVNGRRCALSEVPVEERLLDTLRVRLGLTGTKEGCRSGDCGACTVVAGDRPLLSCLALTHELAGTEVLTIEGASADPMGARVQRAFETAGALQCGYCTPGFVMAIVGLLRERGGAVTSAELLDDLSSNLCRCTGYATIARAVGAIAEPRE